MAAAAERKQTADTPLLEMTELGPFCLCFHGSLMSRQRESRKSGENSKSFHVFTKSWHESWLFF
jgi:hypothetical protein